MKKNLLCFLFLITTVFYAQASDIVHCSGDTYFDLTSQKTDLIGNLDPAQTTLSFHLSLSDAANNANAIVDPSNYKTAARSTTIYARINNNGTITTNSFNLIINNPLIASMTSTSATCDGLNNGSISVTTSGGKEPFSYKLNFGTWQSSNVFNNLSAGNHQLYVKDAIGCMVLMYVTIQGPPVLTATASIEGQTVLMNVHGGTGEYQYSLDGTHFQTSNIFTNLSPGNYNVITKDSSNCGSSSISVIISDLKPLTATAVVTKSIDCFSNASIKISGSGGKGPYQYSLDGEIYQASSIFTNLLSGMYKLAVKDVDNTVAYTNTITIDPVAPLTAKITHTNITNCYDNANCTVEIMALGGLAPYQYSINKLSYQKSSLYSAVYPGTYIVDVRDAKGCIYTTPLIIDSPSAIIATAIVNKQCGLNDTVTITENGGQGPYTYSFDKGVTFSDINTKILPAGTHTFFVKDSNGCNYVTYTTLEINTAISAAINITKPTNADNNDGKITIYANGGKGKLMYALSPNLNTFLPDNTFSNLAPGIYSVIIQDENGCYLNKQTTIDPSAPNINGKNEIIFEFKAGQTLEDIHVNGQNINWYSSKNSITGKTSKFTELTLPLTTVLVDGTTYYASQTVNGIESTERLAVTVKSGALGLNDFVIKDFTYYPNPVENTLTISNTSIIDEVSLTSINGATLLTKQINSLNSEIDLSNFAKGVYFLKVKSEGTEKTVKLIKE